MLAIAAIIAAIEYIASIIPVLFVGLASLGGAMFLIAAIINMSTRNKGGRRSSGVGTFLGSKLSLVGQLVAGLCLAILAVGLGGSIRNTLYMSLNWKEMQRLVTDKHFSELDKLSANGSDQESSAKQIRLLLNGGWATFLSADQKKRLNVKIAELSEGIARRELVRTVTAKQEAARQAENKRKRQMPVKRASLNASITTFLLDSPPELTSGSATYNEREGYLEFYSEVKSGYAAGHKYNFRCLKSGGVIEMDTIVSGGNWRKTAMKCTIGFESNGLPLSIVVQDPADGFISMRGQFTWQGLAITKRQHPEHCKEALTEQEQVVGKVARGKISAKRGAKLLEALSGKVSEC